MTYKEFLQKVENGDYDDYDDRVDVSIEISLIEYGIIRNPKNDECLFYKSNSEPEDNDKIQFFNCDISLNDVKEYLEETATDGFFSFIGSERDIELENLDNDQLAITIMSINQYDGYFNN